MRVRFTLPKRRRVDGAWRRPGDIASVTPDQADDYARRGIAVALDALPNPGTAEGVRPTPSRDVPPDFSDVTETVVGDPEPDARVSIIVPVYRNGRYLAPLFASMIVHPARVPHEVVTVYDGEAAVALPGRTVTLSRNTGYAHANNTGARHVSASSEYLCLLNADTQVTHGWLDAMVRYMDRHPEVAVCGNRHVEPNGRLNSLGSEWSYATGNYEHVGRGRESHPDETHHAIERDMVTFACVLVRRSAWQELGGLDECFRRAYWEDADFCLRARRAGHRIVCLPGSTIVHHVGSSGACGGEHYRHNRELFFRRWVHTGRVDKFACGRGRRMHEGEVVACCIALNEAEYIQASIESIYPLADRIVVVEGGNDFAVKAGWCGPDKRSTDGTVEAIRTVADPDGKVALIQGAWADKAAQRNAYAAELTPGDWMLLLDADEVFTDAGLWRLSALMHEHEIIMPGFHLFWNGFGTVGTGRWADYPQVKAVRWREGYRYRDHNCPSDASGRLITRTRRPFVTPERLYCHYSWVKPVEKLRAKAAYYDAQHGGVVRDYIDNVFLAWRDDPRGVERTFGTHPYGGGGTAAFKGEHPEPIRRRLDAGAFDWLKGEAT